MHSRRTRLRHWGRRNKLKVELVIVIGSILGFAITFIALMAQHL